jgi:hypothetical protein
MSEAKKCDRCGKLYDPEEIVFDYSDMRFRYYLSKDCHPYPEFRLDLCKECRVDLYKWLLRGGAE